MFSALRQNSILYILDKKGTPTLRKAQVSSVTAPHPKGQGFYGNPLDMVVDITLSSNGIQETLKNMPSSLSLANDGNVIIAETPEALSQEVSSLLNASRQVIESVPYHEKAVASYGEMLKELNPQYAKEKQQEEKISSLEQSIGNLQASIGDMKQLLAQALNKTN